MLGLPKSTELSQALPKTRIFAKFELRSTQKDRFDEDISRITIVNEISQRKVPALHPGKEVQSIYVLEIQLKRKDYDPKNIQLLSKLIPQNILFLLRFDDQVQLVIYHTKLLMSDWCAEPELVISGLDMDAVWENIVKTVGTIEVEEGNTLAEQITIDDEKAKLKLQIEQLEEKSRKEKQPRKKLEMFEQLKEMKKQLE
ncbi:MAG: DUF4391 domain-containing protein [Bacteroidales bacterium]|nr:DUF4391 domain-containing protein [Bacteroidales bacterium]